MIACVSPADRDSSETRSTLDYATNARKIRNTVRLLLHASALGAQPPSPKVDPVQGAYCGSFRSSSTATTAHPRSQS